MGEEQYLIGNFLNGIPWALYIRLSHRVSFPGGFSISILIYKPLDLWILFMACLIDKCLTKHLAIDILAI